MLKNQPFILKNNSPRTVEVSAGSLNAKSKTNIVKSGEISDLKNHSVEIIKNEFKNKNLNIDNNELQKTDKNNLKENKIDQSLLLIKNGIASKNIEKITNTEAQNEHKEKIINDSYVDNEQEIQSETLLNSTIAVQFNKEQKTDHKKSVESLSKYQSLNVKIESGSYQEENIKFEKKESLENFQEINQSINAENNIKILSNQEKSNNQFLNPNINSSNTKKIVQDIVEDNNQMLGAPEQYDKNFKIYHSKETLKNSLPISKDSIDGNEINISSGRRNNVQSVQGSDQKVNKQLITSESSSTNIQSIDVDSGGVQNNQKLSSSLHENSSNDIEKRNEFNNSIPINEIVGISRGESISISEKSEDQTINIDCQDNTYKQKISTHQESSNDLKNETNFSDYDHSSKSKELILGNEKKFKKLKEDSNHQKVDFDQSDSEKVLFDNDILSTQLTVPEKTEAKDELEIDFKNSISNDILVENDSNQKNNQTLAKEIQNTNKVILVGHQNSVNRAKIPSSETIRNNAKDVAEQNIVPKSKVWNSDTGLLDIEENSSMLQVSEEVNHPIAQETKNTIIKSNSSVQKLISAVDQKVIDDRKKRQEELVEKKRKAEEFHGRVEAIRNSVKGLNARLDKIENMHPKLLS